MQAGTCRHFPTRGRWVDVVSRRTHRRYAERYGDVIKLVGDHYINVWRGQSREFISADVRVEPLTKIAAAGLGIEASDLVREVRRYIEGAS